MAFLSVSSLYQPQMHLDSFEWNLLCNLLVLVLHCLRSVAISRMPSTGALMAQLQTAVEVCCRESHLSLRVG